MRNTFPDVSVINESTLYDFVSELYIQIELQSLVRSRVDNGQMHAFPVFFAWPSMGQAYSRVKPEETNNQSSDGPRLLETHHGRPVDGPKKLTMYRFCRGLHGEV